MRIKALAILILASSAFGQPPEGHDRGSPPPMREGGESSKPAPLDSETLRKRLTQTLEFAKQIVEKNESAIAQLDAGEDPRQVMQELRTPIPRRIASQPRQARGPDQSPASHQHPAQQSYSKRDLKRVRRFINEHLSKLDSQLKMIEELSPESTDKLLARLAPKVIDILRIQESNPAMAEFKLEELKAGLNYVDATSKYRALINAGSADQSQQEQALEAVRQAASDRFDAQVQIKQYEIHELTLRIHRLQLALEELASEREEQVDAQVNAAQRNRGVPSKRATQFKQQLLESQKDQHPEDQP